MQRFPTWWMDPYVLDAAYLSLKGMLEAGFAGMMLFGSDKHRIYDTARQVGLWHDLAHVLGRTFGGRQPKQFVTFLDPFET
jgi:hypothetical protein